MPVESPNYPPDGFSSRVVNVQATGAMTGKLLEDNGALTTLALRMTTMGVGACVWEALAYLDVIEGRTQKLAGLSHEINAMRNSLGALAGVLEGLSAKLDDVHSQLAVLGVHIPWWTTEDGVLNGEWDSMGINRMPSASELGLVLELTRVHDPLALPGGVIEIDPPSDTFVSRGSRVKVTVNSS